jgi:hypothetical protein
MNDAFATIRRNHARRYRARMGSVEYQQRQFAADHARETSLTNP